MKIISAHQRGEARVQEKKEMGSILQSLPIYTNKLALRMPKNRAVHEPLRYLVSQLTCYF